MKQINLTRKQVIKAIGKTCYNRGIAIDALRYLSGVIIENVPYSYVDNDYRRALKYYPDSELVQINYPKFRAYYKQISIPRKLFVKIV